MVNFQSILCPLFFSSFLHAVLSFTFEFLISPLCLPSTPPLEFRKDDKSRGEETFQKTKTSTDPCSQKRQRGEFQGDGEVDGQEFDR
jgi:hypothetical protein